MIGLFDSRKKICFTNEVVMCVFTGPELGDGPVGGLLTQHKLKCDALSTITEDLLGIWTEGCSWLKWHF